MTIESVRSLPLLRRRLLAWYDRERRVLPWRAPAGVTPDPYHVWLSEIMLQQTTVVTVAPYYARFLVRWPTVQALAAASLDEVLHAWQGLGYYARARNLHRCAQAVAGRLGGRFPDHEEALRGLPGIGAYTAAAIAAIAFNRRAAPVDGNVERVIARLHAIAEPLPQAKAKIAALARALAPARRAGDFAQALMDLGATVCTPRRPRCGACPWAEGCAARHAGDPESYPRRLPAKARPLRHGVVFWATDRRGRVLLRRRAEEGLWGGLAEFPSTPWREQPWNLAEARRHAPVSADWTPLPGEVAHGFTHFRLRLLVVAGRARAGAKAKDGGFWQPAAELHALALPTAMRRVASLVLTSPVVRAKSRAPAARPPRRRQPRRSGSE